MNRTRTLLASVLALAVAASCGPEAAKTPVVKNLPGATSAKASKGVADDAARHAAFNTDVLRSQRLSKGVFKIALGQTVEGRLTADETTTEEGKHQDLWVLTLDAPTEISIAMTSGEIDTYLDLDHVVKFNAAGEPVLEHLAEDDDSYGGTDAGLEGKLEAGTFVVFATTYEPGQSGAYTLAVTEAENGPAASAGEAVSVSMEPGTTYSGTLSENDAKLDDGTYYQMVRFRGHAGDQMTATLSSPDFDSYLLLAAGAGELSSLEKLADNDDADGTTVDSRIVFDLPEDGIYTLVVNTYDGGTGAYQLRVETSAPDYSRFSAGPTDPAGKYALVVGINDYPGSQSDLTGPTHDADIIAQTLIESYGFDPQNVIVLKDSEGTRANIAHGIADHLGKAGPDGVSVLFYSGHGTRLDENIGYLDNEADGRDEGLYLYGYGQESSVLLDEELGYLLSQLKGHTFAAIDACFSGTISRAPGVQAKRADISDPDVRDNLRLPKTFIADELGTGYAFGGTTEAMADLFRTPERDIVMSSSSEEQVSWTVGDWPDGSEPTSLFAYFLAKELRAADARTTFRSLMQRIDEQVNSYVANSGGKYKDQDTQLVGQNLDRPVRAFLKAK
jgi:hypothetical protein